MITKISFLLIVISGLIHPLWNMLLKKSEDKMIFYLNIHLFFTAAFSFILLLYPLKEVTSQGWFLVISSAFLHFFYQIFLCRTYELGDMSLAYPIIRSSPIFVLLMGILFLKEMPSREAVMGIGIVMLGVQIINQKEWPLSKILFSFAHIDKRIMLAGGLTAFMSACYSIIDKIGVLAVHPVLFFYLFFAISGLLFLIYVLSMKERRARYFELSNRDKLSIAVASILEFSSYILILYAFRISKVAYIIGLRQISVIFGTLYGIVYLKERYGKIRFVGSVVMFAGIFLITVFG